MKFIMRIDDVGYTHIHNLGSFEAIDRGIATSADVMMDCPGTVEALEFLRERPWISVGWHTHFWGSPVLPTEQVPSLIVEEAGRIRFRKDIIFSQEVVYEEIYAEAKAQIERCIRILGRAPDTGSGHMDTPFGNALKAVSREYGMKLGYEKTAKYDPPNFFQRGEDGPDAFIYMINPEAGLNMMRYDTVKEALAYEPLRYFTEDPSHILDYGDDEVVMFALHPGNVDYFMEFQGDYGPGAPYYLLTRPIDTHCLCSEALRAWVRENNVELVNFHDALYGTRQYQVHLKHIGSDLYKGI